MKKSHGLSSDEDETSPERNTRGRHTTRRRHTDTDLDNNDPGRSRFSEVDNLNTSLTFPYVRHENARTTGPLEMDDAKECSSGLNSSPTFGQLKKLSNQPNKLDDSTDISPDNTEAFIGNIKSNPQIHVESADPKVKQLENSRKHRKRKHKKRTTRRSPGAATNTMRTYVNPNFLSRTVSEVCISSANLASDETNETSPLEALKQEENDSVNSQSSTTNSHFLRPKNPERRERSPAGSELESSEENRALGIRNQIQLCTCSKCGKRLRPFEAPGSNDNRENVQPPDHDTAYEVHQTQEYTRLIRGFFQSGLTKRSSSYNKHVEGPFLCDHDKHGDHRLHRGMHGRKCSCRSQSKKFRKPPAENDTKTPNLSSDESLERRRSQFRSGSREPMDASRKASADSNHRSSIDAKRASRCSCRVCKGRKDRALCNKNSNVEAWYGPRKVDSDREQYLSKTDTEKSLLRTGDASRESKKLVNFSENSETSDPEEKVSRTCKCGLLNTTRKDSKTCSCAIPRPVLHRSDTSARVKPSTISKGSWMESRSNSAQIKPSKCSGITANNSYVKQEQIRGIPPNKCKCIKCRRRSEFVSPPPTSRTEDGGRRNSGQIKPSESSKVMVSVDVDTVQEQVKRAPPNKCKCAKCRGRSELSPPPVTEDVSRHSSGQTKPIKSSARITNVDGGTVQKQGTQTQPSKCRCAKCSRKSEFCQPPITSQVEDGSRHSRGQLTPSNVAEPTKNVYTDNTRTPSTKCNCNRCKQKSDTTQPLSKPPQDTPKGKECLCSSCGRKRRPSSEMPPSCTEETPPKPETEPRSSEEPKRQPSESSLPTPITSSLLAPIVPPPPTPAQLTSSDENEINRPSSTEFLDGVKPEPHTPNCICSICIDKSKCGITPPKKDELVPVETKPFDRTQIPQHPSNPAVIETTTSQSEEPCPCMQCENRRRDLKCETLDLVRTKSKSVVGLLQRPRIPSRVHTSIKPREEKGIHTYDCTCKICQEQDKHPIEEKKKKWRLPWSSAHPIELKPKPEPAQIKPWKVSEIFRHPRIPANPPKPREPSEVYLPPKIDDKCPCEKDRIFTDKVETKHSSIADICRKPRLTPPIDQEPSFSRIFGDHAKDCKCKKCEDRAKCQKEVARPRPESVQTKSSGLLELLRHPRIPNAVDSEEKEVPVKTKSNPELISWKRERVDLQKSTSCPCVKCSDDKLPESKVHLKPVSIQSVIQHHPRIPQPIDNKRKSSRLESKEDKLRPRPSMESVDIKPVEHSPNCICQACTSQSNYEPEPSYDSSKVTTSSRRPEALCQRPRLPILMDFRPPKSVKPERDSCTCEREIITQSKIVTKRTSITTLLQRPRIPLLLNNKPKRSQSIDYLTVKRKTLTQTLQKPRLSSYTPTCSRIYHEEHRRTCKCTICVEPAECLFPSDGIEEASSTCEPPTKPQEVEVKPWYVSNILQHPRIPNAIDDKPAKIRSETGYAEVCPCSEKSSKKRKTGTRFHSFPSLRGSGPDEFPIQIKRPSISDLCRAPRILGYEPKPLECQCETVCLDKSKCQPPRKAEEHSIETKPLEIGRILQRPRIPVGIDGKVVGKTEPVKTKPICSKEEICPCIEDPHKDELPLRRDTGSTEVLRSSVDSILKKPWNVVNILQRPRIPFQEKSVRKCICTECRDPALCTHAEKAGPEPMNVKRQDLSQICQHPRIPNAIDSEPVEQATPVCTKKEKETCPCDTPRIECESPSIDQKSSESVITKPRNIANIFQHPRIPFQEIPSKTCDCTKCEDAVPCKHSQTLRPEPVLLKQEDISKVFQRPRILNSIDTRLVKEPKHCEEGTCPCQNEKARNPCILDFIGRPRIPQTTSERPKSPKHKNENPVVTKSKNSANILQHPRLHFQELPPEDCVCTKLEGTEECKPIKEKSYDPVRTKSNDFLNMFQGPRIPRSVDYNRTLQTTPVQVSKKEKCPCVCESPKRSMSFDFCQKPRIPQVIDSKERKSRKSYSEPVLTKPRNISHVFQHPRIPFHEMPMKSCNCTKCGEPAPCKHSNKQQPEAVITKRNEISKMFQHPRIPSPIDTHPPKEPKPQIDQYEGCTCKCEKPHTPLSLEFCQRPRIPQMIDTKERLPPSESSDSVIVKPVNIASVFQHPRIPFQEAPAKKCICTKCGEDSPCHHTDKEHKSNISTKPTNISKLFQHPRIPSIIGTHLPKEVIPRIDDDESCPCEKPKTPFSFEFCQRPRIPQPINTKEKKPPTERPDSVLRKTTDITSILQRPRIPFQEMPVEECSCSKAGDPEKCKHKKQKVCQPVTTKSTDSSKMFQHPRIPHSVDYNATSQKSPVQVSKGEKCPCVCEPPKRSMSFDFCQKPRIPRAIDVKSKEPKKSCSEPILTKPRSAANVFQHPRIPFQEMPVKPCTCTKCGEPSPCQHAKRKPYEPVTTKHSDVSKMFQHPRIPSAINVRPPKGATSRSNEDEPCPCDKPKTPFSFEFCQRPRIPQPINTKERQPSSESSDSVLFKPTDITRIFQRPRIPFQEVPAKECLPTEDGDVEKCKHTKRKNSDHIRTKSNDFLKVFRHPRIPSSVDYNPVLPKSPVQISKSEKCPCSCDSPKRSKSFDFCQKPRIPQPIDNKEKKPKKSRSDPALIKPRSVASIFQHPRIPFQEIPAKACTCSKFEEPCKHSQGKKSKPVKTKRGDVSQMFRHPRIPSAVDTRPPKQAEPHSDDDESSSCKCGKPKSPFSFDFCQRPRIPQSIDTKERKPVAKSSDLLIKPANIANIFQHPRIPFQEGPAKKCTCTKYGTGDPCEHTSEEHQRNVSTNSIDISSIFQRPRILNAIDTKPKSEEEPKECPCSPEKTENIISRIVRTKPFSVFSLFQHPRIPIQTTWRSIPEESGELNGPCLCGRKSKERNICPDVLSPTADNYKRRPSTVSTKPWNLLKAFQHPRIPIPIDYRVLREPTSDRPCPDLQSVPSCLCAEESKKPNKLSRQVLTKSSTIASIFQHPRIPGTTGVFRHPKNCPCDACSNRVHRRSTITSLEMKPCQTTKRATAGQIKTRYSNISSIFRRPRILNQMDHPKKIPPCRCHFCAESKHSLIAPSQSKLSTGPKREKSKPFNMSRIFQHPRIPVAVDRIFSNCDENRQCSCDDPCDYHKHQKEKRKKQLDRAHLTANSSSIRRRQSHIKTRPSYLVNMFQHPRISAIDFGAKTPKRQDRSRCSCHDQEEEWSKSSSLSCPYKENKKPVFEPTVRTKPFNFSNVYQKPGILGPIDTKTVAEPKCPCYEYSDKDKPKSEKPTKDSINTDSVQVKSQSVWSIFQHPRIPSQIQPYAIHPNRHHPEYCDCINCRTSKKRKSETTTKRVTLSAIFQRPRILNAIDTKRFVHKTCVCDICKDRQICEVIYDKKRKQRDKCMNQEMSNSNVEEHRRHAAGQTDVRTNIIKTAGFAHPIDLKPHLHLTDPNRRTCNCEVCEGKVHCTQERQEPPNLIRHKVERKPKDKTKIHICGDCKRATEEGNGVQPQPISAEVHSEQKSCCCKICQDTSTCLDAKTPLPRPLIQHKVDVKPKEPKPVIPQGKCTCNNCQRDGLYEYKRHAGGEVLPPCSGRKRPLPEPFLQHETKVKPQESEPKESKPEVLNTKFPEDSGRRQCQCDSCKRGNLCDHSRQPAGEIVPTQDYKVPVETSKVDDPKSVPDTQGKPISNETKSQISNVRTRPPREGCNCRICKEKSKCFQIKPQLPEPLIQHKVEIKPKESKPKEPESEVAGKRKGQCSCDSCKRGDLCEHIRKTAGEVLPTHGFKELVQTRKTTETTPATQGKLIDKEEKPRTHNLQTGAWMEGCNCRICKENSKCSQLKAPLPTPLIQHAVDIKPKELKVKESKSEVAKPINCISKEQKRHCTCDNCMKGNQCERSRHSAGGALPTYVPTSERIEPKTVLQEKAIENETKPGISDVHSEVPRQGCNCKVCKDKSKCSQSKTPLPEPLIQYGVEVKPKEPKLKELGPKDTKPKVSTSKEGKGQCTCDSCKKGDVCKRSRKPAGETFPTHGYKVPLETSKVSEPASAPNIQEKPTNDESKPRHSDPQNRVPRGDCNCSKCSQRRASPPTPLTQHKVEIKPREPKPVEPEANDLKPKDHISKEPEDRCKCDSCKRGEMCERLRQTAGESLPVKGCKDPVQIEKTPELIPYIQGKPTENELKNENPKIQNVPPREGCNCRICKEKSKCSQSKVPLSTPLIQHKVEVKPKESKPKKPKVKASKIVDFTPKDRNGQCSCDSCKRGDLCERSRKPAGEDPPPYVQTTKVPESTSRIQEKPVDDTTKHKIPNVQSKVPRGGCDCRICKEKSKCSQSKAALPEPLIQNQVEVKPKDPKPKEPKPGVLKSKDCTSNDQKGQCTCDSCKKGNSCERTRQPAGETIPTQHYKELVDTNKIGELKPNIQVITIDDIPKPQTPNVQSRAPREGCNCRICKEKSKCSQSKMPLPMPLIQHMVEVKPKEPKPKEPKPERLKTTEFISKKEKEQCTCDSCKKGDLCEKSRKSAGGVPSELPIDSNLEQLTDKPKSDLHVPEQEFCSCNTCKSKRIPSKPQEDHYYNEQSRPQALQEYDKPGPSSELIRQQTCPCHGKKQCPHQLNDSAKSQSPLAIVAPNIPSKTNSQPSSLKEASKHKTCHCKKCMEGSSCKRVSFIASQSDLKTWSTENQENRPYCSGPLKGKSCNGNKSGEGKSWSHKKEVSSFSLRDSSVNYLSEKKHCSCITCQDKMQGGDKKKKKRRWFS